MNLLLISNKIRSIDKFKIACNKNTKYVVYDDSLTLSDIQMRINILNLKEIKHLGFVFEETNSCELFEKLGNELFIILGRNGLAEGYVAKFIRNLIQKYKIQYVDFLACNLLKNDLWKAYFRLIEEYKVIVRSSNDLTGNLKDGGDWILESSNESIRDLYFTDKIRNWDATLHLGSASTGFITHDTSNNIYMSGDNQYGHLGMGTVGGNHYTYQPLSSSDPTLQGKKLLQISIGQYHAGCVTNESSNNIFMWGSNLSGQLGAGVGSAASYYTPQNITSVDVSSALINKRVTQLSCGISNTSCITNDSSNNAYVWGQFIGYSPVNACISPSVLNGKQITQTSSGYGVTAYIDSMNNLYTAGYQWGGAVGNGVHAGSYSTIALVSPNVDIVSVGHSCGAYITTDASNNLYTWGANEYGQLGKGYVDAVLNSANYTPVNICDSDSVLFGKKIIKVVAGQRHMICITDEESNNIYSWGSNDLYRLGYSGTGTMNFRPLCIGTTSGNLLSGKKIVDINTYIEGGMCFTNEYPNNMYLWGNNMNGALGNSKAYGTGYLPFKNGQFVDKLFGSESFMYSTQTTPTIIDISGVTSSFGMGSATTTNYDNLTDVSNNTITFSLVSDESSNPLGLAESKYISPTPNDVRFDSHVTFDIAFTDLYESLNTLRVQYMLDDVLTDASTNSQDFIYYTTDISNSKIVIHTKRISDIYVGSDTVFWSTIQVTESMVHADISGNSNTVVYFSPETINKDGFTTTEITYDNAFDYPENITTNLRNDFLMTIQFDPSDASFNDFICVTIVDTQQRWVVYGLDDSSIISDMKNSTKVYIDNTQINRITISSGGTYANNDVSNLDAFFIIDPSLNVFKIYTKVLKPIYHGVELNRSLDTTDWYTMDPVSNVVNINKGTASYINYLSDIPSLTEFYNNQVSIYNDNVNYIENLELQNSFPESIINTKINNIHFEPTGSSYDGYIYFDMYLTQHKNLNGNNYSFFFDSDGPNNETFVITKINKNSDVSNNGTYYVVDPNNSGEKTMVRIYTTENLYAIFYAPNYTEYDLSNTTIEGFINHQFDNVTYITYDNFADLYANKLTCHITYNVTTDYSYPNDVFPTRNIYVNLLPRTVSFDGLMSFDVAVGLYNLDSDNFAVLRLDGSDLVHVNKDEDVSDTGYYYTVTDASTIRLHVQQFEPIYLAVRNGETDLSDITVSGFTNFDYNGVTEVTYATHEDVSNNTLSCTIENDVTPTYVLPDDVFPEDVTRITLAPNSTVFDDFVSFDISINNFDLDSDNYKFLYIEDDNLVEMTLGGDASGLNIYYTRETATTLRVFTKLFQEIYMAVGRSENDLSDVSMVGFTNLNLNGATKLYYNSYLDVSVNSLELTTENTYDNLVFPDTVNIDTVTKLSFDPSGASFDDYISFDVEVTNHPSSYKAMILINSSFVQLNKDADVSDNGIYITCPANSNIVRVFAKQFQTVYLGSGFLCVIGDVSAVGFTVQNPYEMTTAIFNSYNDFLDRTITYSIDNNVDISNITFPGTIFTDNVSKISFSPNNVVFDRDEELDGSYYSHKLITFGKAWQNVGGNDNLRVFIDNGNNTVIELTRSYSDTTGLPEALFTFETYMSDGYVLISNDNILFAVNTTNDIYLCTNKNEADISSIIIDDSLLNFSFNTIYGSVSVVQFYNSSDLSDRTFSVTKITDASDTNDVFDDILDSYAVGSHYRLLPHNVIMNGYVSFNVHVDVDIVINSSFTILVDRNESNPVPWGIFVIDASTIQIVTNEFRDFYIGFNTEYPKPFGVVSTSTDIVNTDNKKLTFSWSKYNQNAYVKYIKNISGMDYTYLFKYLPTITYQIYKSENGTYYTALTNGTTTNLKYILTVPKTDTTKYLLEAKISDAYHETPRYSLLTRLV